MTETIFKGTEKLIANELAEADKKKVFVLDTNVIMADPDSIFKFQDNIVIIPSVVIEELDNHKRDMGDIGYNVRHAHQNLKQLRDSGNLTEGVPTKENGLVMVVPISQSQLTYMPPTWDTHKPDNLILITAKVLQLQFPKTTVIIVSNDTNMQIKADEIEIVAEDYLHERVEEDYLSYNGRSELFVTDSEFDDFRTGCLDRGSAQNIANRNGTKLHENTFVMLKHEVTGGTLIGKVRNGNITFLEWDNSKPFGIIPRNLGQRFAIEALMSPAEDVPLVIMTGPAGTAKTFLTLACGLQQTLENRIYRRIVITRANVEFDKAIGALPGSEEAKINPLVRGCLDNLELLIDEKGIRSLNTREDEISDKVNYLFDIGAIKAEALGFLRGRSMTRQYIFVDEAQNTSVSQMKGILTRAGEGSKVILCGDLDQIDNPKLDRHNNGLAYALKLMSDDPMCAVVGFSS